MKPIIATCRVITISKHYEGCLNYSLLYLLKTCHACVKGINASIHGINYIAHGNGVNLMCRWHHMNS